VDDARGHGAAFVHLLRWPPSRLVLAAVCSLVGLTYLATGLTAGRLPASERLGLADLLEFPELYRSLPAMVLLFGGVLVAAYAGALGGAEAGPPGLGPTRDPVPPHFTMLRTFASLSVVLFVGVVAAYGVGVLMALLAAALSGRATDAALDPVVIGELPALLVRGWWGIVMLAAIAFAAGVVTASRAAGLIVVVVIFLAEQSASLVTGPDGLWWAPIAVASSIVSSDAATLFANAAVISIIYVAGSLAVTLWLVARQRAATRPR
jgi:hypothetical protein